MHPPVLAPIDTKARALTTIYAPRTRKTRKNKTAQSRMLDEVQIKPTLTQFHPLPAIGKTKPVQDTVIVYDINRNEASKLHEILKPIPPSSIMGYRRQRTMDLRELEDKPHHLLRENTYDVIKPIFLKSPKVKKRDIMMPRMCKKMEENSELSENDKEEPKESPKTRFKNAAYQVANLSSSLPQTGKLLCLRERETFPCLEDKKCKLEDLPESPGPQLDQLSEIFRCLEMKGRIKDKIKKDNSWF